MPAQVIITCNKEAVLSEKQLTAHFGQTILVGYSRLINAAEYSEPQGFFDEVQRVWDAEWQRVYSADWSGVRLVRVTMNSLPQPVCDKGTI